MPSPSPGVSFHGQVIDLCDGSLWWKCRHKLSRRGASGAVLEQPGAKESQASARNSQDTQHWRIMNVSPDDFISLI